MIAQRLRQARLAAGLTQDEAVDRLGGLITKAALSNYENAKRAPHASVLQALGKVYGVRARWFVDEAKAKVTWHAFRAAAKLGARKRDGIRAFVQRHVDGYLEVCGLFPAESADGFPPRRRVRDACEADRLAEQLRQRWALGRDALESVTQCLETQGAMIVHVCAKPDEGFDGLSGTIDGKRPLLVVNSAVPVDRLRFNLAHELGHVLMDTSSARDAKQEELLAHRFASSFLVPPSVVKSELGPRRGALTLAELLLLKEKYGMSVGAWLMAARAQGIVSAAYAESLWRELSRRGWRKAEPEVFHGNERPTRMRQLLLRAVAEGLLGVERALEIMPDLRTSLAAEGLLTDTPANRLGRLSRTQRQERMRDAAALAAADYAADGSLAEARTHVGDDFHEYE